MHGRQAVFFPSSLTLLLSFVLLLVVATKKTKKSYKLTDGWSDGLLRALLWRSSTAAAAWARWIARNSMCRACRGRLREPSNWRCCERPETPDRTPSDARVHGTTAPSPPPVTQAALPSHRRRRAALEGTRHHAARRCSFSRGISSTRLQGRWRLSSCQTRMSSQASLQAPVEPGSANR